MFFGGLFGSGMGDSKISGKRSRSKREWSGLGEPQRHVVQHGTAVVVRDLTKRTEHNGRIGQIIQWDGSKARYKVQLQPGCEQHRADDDALWVRPQNLTQLCDVQVTGLAKRCDLNGSRGTIFNYDESKQRYMVLVHGAALSLQLGNCILDKGTCVTLHGLSKPDCNGKMACVVDVDCSAMRYTVECDTGKRIKVKFENVLC